MTRFHLLPMALAATLAAGSVQADVRKFMTHM